MRTEQSYTGVGPEDRCSSWGLDYPDIDSIVRSVTATPVVIVK